MRNIALASALVGLGFATTSTRAEMTTYCCDQAAEDAYVAALGQLGVTLETLHESFESGPWINVTTTPAPSITNRGVTWSRLDAGLLRSTGGGNVVDGSFLMFTFDSVTFGHANPDAYLVSTTGTGLHGFGAWIRATGAKMAFDVDGDPDRVNFTGEDATVVGWKFLGFVDDQGFGQVYVRTDDEMGGEVETFFTDDVTLGAEEGVFAPPDTDGDGVADPDDNCSAVSNADQRDTDTDDLGNRCDADFDQDCVVNASDLGIMKQAFFSADALVDLDGDGVVNVIDLGLIRQAFFLPPGPSGLPNLCEPQ